MAYSFLSLLGSLAATLLLLNFEGNEPYPNIGENYYDLRDSILFLGTKEFYLIAVITLLFLSLFRNKKLILTISYTSLWLIVVYYCKKILARDTIANGGGFFQEIDYGLLPSGHSIVYLFTAQLIFIFLNDKIDNNSILLLIKSILVLGFILLSLSLVGSNYHYISDITASIALFVFSNIIYKYFLGKIIYKRA
jgi:membrane-associated phospholipid phosphatase